jgi:hypothetical protein
MVSPRDTYAALARTPVRTTIVTALRRPLLVAVLFGVAAAITSTRRVSPALVASTTIAWSYVVVLQLAVALALVAPAARRGLGVARAVDLFFAGHAPWSLFVLLVAAWGPSPAGLPFWPLEIAALVPLLLTVRIIAAFFRDGLGLDERRARRMTIAHQAITWTMFLAVNWLSSAFTPRLLELGARW